MAAAAIISPKQSLDTAMKPSRIWLLLFLVEFVLAAPLIGQTNSAVKFESEIAAFAASDKTNPPPTDAVLFVGSSSIRRWTTLARDFADTPVINRGFGGAQISDVLYFFDKLIPPYKPKKIVFYCGGNDINAGKSPKEVMRDFILFHQRVQRLYQNLPVIVISVGPSPSRWAQVEKVRVLNAALEAYAKGTPTVTYVDVFSLMLGPDGQPRPDIYVEDRLHLNPEGYKIWIAALKDLVAGR